jgi:hypothetical protein
LCYDIIFQLHSENYCKIIAKKDKIEPIKMFNEAFSGERPEALISDR